MIEWHTLTPEAREEALSMGWAGAAIVTTVAGLEQRGHDRAGGAEGPPRRLQVITDLAQAKAQGKFGAAASHKQADGPWTLVGVTLDDYANLPDAAATAWADIITINVATVRGSLEHTARALSLLRPAKKGRQPVFEVVTAPVIQSGRAARRSFIELLKQLAKWTNGARIVLSSGASDPTLVRRPEDLANLLCLAGLPYAAAAASLAATNQQLSSLSDDRRRAAAAVPTPFGLSGTKRARSTRKSAPAAPEETGKRGGGPPPAPAGAAPSVMDLSSEGLTHSTIDLYAGAAPTADVAVAVAVGHPSKTQGRATLDDSSESDSSAGADPPPPAAARTVESAARGAEPPRKVRAVTKKKSAGLKRAR
ncbi:hypothetical protein DIPPA_06443 [Diplonema papillatum]|nr:hypothetical protein DIPPA_06443 [Diplonema papillatum]